MNFHVHRHVKADGRELFLFGRDVHRDAPLPELATECAKPSHLRWHPLRREWVVFAAARQARTFLPSAQDCPLCPVRNGRAGEVPFEDFEIAVFENRFPAFASNGAVPAPVSGVDVAVASGRCEVVIYASDHQASLATLSDQRLSLLIAVWGARVKALRDMGFVCVLPFENRGEEIGVTLHHPHGQIYAFSFLPAQLRVAAEAQAEAPVIARLLATLDPALVIVDEDLALSFVPPFAMYPYEVWLAPRRRVPSPDLLTDEERSALACALGDAMRRLDALFDAPMPYIMTVQTAPQGFEDSYHMVIEIRPFRRDADKLKYLAGVEQGAGIFLADILPEDAARRLRQVRR
jgi:UDPglucose--hexose-1-phosphate uridylyltransferase